MSAPYVCVWSVYGKYLPYYKYGTGLSKKTSCRCLGYNLCSCRNLFIEFINFRMCWVVTLLQFDTGYFRESFRHFVVLRRVAQYWHLLFKFWAINGNHVILRNTRSCFSSNQYFGPFWGVLECTIRLGPLECNSVPQHGVTTRILELQRCITQPWNGSSDETCWWVNSSHQPATMTIHEA